MRHADGRKGRADEAVRANAAAPEVKSGIRLDKSIFPEGFFTLEGLSAPYMAPMQYEQIAQAAYLQNPVAHRCIRLVSEAISSLDLVVGDECGETFDTHPLLSLMRRPNERQGMAEFLQTLTGHYVTRKFEWFFREYLG
ncbi:MAG: hypothetical protein AAF141_02885 [Pseudomonadota bacterium]